MTEDVNPNTINPLTLKDLGWKKTQMKSLEYVWSHPNSDYLVQLSISMESGKTWTLVGEDETEIYETDLNLVQSLSNKECN